jgi:hypothetical protein
VAAAAAAAAAAAVLVAVAVSVSVAVAVLVALAVVVVVVVAAVSVAATAATLVARRRGFRGFFVGEGAEWGQAERRYGGSGSGAGRRSVLRESGAEATSAQTVPYFRGEWRSHCASSSPPELRAIRALARALA